METWMYAAGLAVKRIRARRWLSLFACLSLCCAMMPPMLGISVIDAYDRELSASRDSFRIGDTAQTAYAYRCDMPYTPDVFTNIMNMSLPLDDAYLLPTAVLYEEYILTDTRAGNTAGIFSDLMVLYADFCTPEALSVLFTGEDERQLCAVSDGILQKENICMLDRVSATMYGLSVGDTVSVRGRRYTVGLLFDDDSRVFFVTDAILSDDTAIPHTLYLFADSTVSEKDLRNAMREALPMAKNGQLLALAETLSEHAAKLERIKAWILLITGVFLAASVLSLVAIRRGVLLCQRHDYAVAWALGAGTGLLFFEIMTELLLLFFPAGLVCVMLLFVLRLLPLFPIMPVISSAALGFSFGLITVCALLVTAVFVKEMQQKEDFRV